MNRARVWRPARTRRRLFTRTFLAQVTAPRPCKPLTSDRSLVTRHSSLVACIIASMPKAQPRSVTDRLAKERNIWIVTVRPEGQPHMVPVWFAWVGEKIYICIEPGSVKGRNLAHNRNVSLALERGSHPVICEGEAQFIEKPWPEEVVTLFRKKYDWDVSSERQYTLLVEITPRKWLHW